MPKGKCKCGTQYSFPDEAAGKRAKCKNCGEVFTLGAKPKKELETFSIAPEPDLGEEAAAAAAVARARDMADTRPKQGEVYAAPGSPQAVGSLGHTPGSGFAASDAEPPRTYAADVLWTFLFPATPSNLITFIVMWVAMVLAPLAGCVPLLGLFLLLVVMGWYYAFLFEVMRTAAAGESELPDINLIAAGIADVVVPLGSWIASWIIVFTPAMCYVSYTVAQGATSMDSIWPMVAGGVNGLLSAPASDLLMFNLLVYLGLFFWPIVILCIAMGGLATLYRFDLIVLTIIRTFPVYALTLMLMFGAVFLHHMLLEFASTHVANKTASQAGAGAALGLETVFVAVATGVEVYLDIVLMRLIGLYYHHFKAKFAWSWG